MSADFKLLDDEVLVEGTMSSYNNKPTHINGGTMPRPRPSLGKLIRRKGDPPPAWRRNVVDRIAEIDKILQNLKMERAFLNKTYLTKGK